jgi:peptide/nickel transport system permease protein
VITEARLKGTIDDALPASLDDGPSEAGPGWARLLFRRWTVMLGLGLLGLVLLAAAFAPIVARFDPNAIQVAARLQAPSLTHVFGTDDFGRDIFSRVVYGARASLVIGAAVVVLAVGLGTLVGLFSGFYRIADAILSRIVDGLMSFPGLVLAIAMMGVLGASKLSVVLALGIVYMPRVARVVRGSVLVVKELSFVEAAIALGARRSFVLFRHVLPNCLSPLIVQASFIFSYAVLGEAALSFLGVGVPPIEPSWGNMLADSRTYIVKAWWIAVFPGGAIMLTVLGLNLFGDGLRDMLDPKLRKL